MNRFPVDEDRERSDADAPVPIRAKRKQTFRSGFPVPTTGICPADNRTFFPDGLQRTASPRWAPNTGAEGRRPPARTT